MCFVWPAAYARCQQGKYDGEVEKLLLALESFADDRYWLAERTKALTDKRQLFLPGHPPAAIVDWLYVEDGWSEKVEREFRKGPTSAGPWLDIRALDKETANVEAVPTIDSSLDGSGE